MADTLHLSLSAFRDTMLTAVARLEFQLRDATVERPAPSTVDLTSFKTELSEALTTHTKDVSAHTSRIDSLEIKVSNLQEQIAALLKATEETKELLNIPAPPSTTKNILVSTPALAAAVAAAMPPTMELVDDESEEEAEEAEEEVEEEAEAEEEAEDDGPELKQVVIKGKQYFMDAENSVYVETDEGYEEIGTYNPKLDCIEGAEEEEAEAPAEEEAEEEEGIEVEEFLYKGKTYQRDNENNVYDDGEHIGTWNGKKIIPLA